MQTRYLTTILFAAVLSGCGATPAFQQGPDAEVTYDGLTRVDNTVMDTVWARTDIDIKGYDKIMFQGVGVEYRPAKGPYSGRTSALEHQRSSQTEFKLDEATKAAFEAEVRDAFLAELGTSKVYQIVEEAGPDVLLINSSLLDVVSRVPPETIGRSNIYISSVGEATLVLEIRDSMSGAIFARAVDRRAAEREGWLMDSNRVTNRAEVRRLARAWGRLLRQGLERLMTEGV